MNQRKLQVLPVDTRPFMRDDDTQSWNRRVAYMSTNCSKAFFCEREIPNFDDVAPFFEDENDDRLIDPFWLMTGEEFKNIHDGHWGWD